MIGSGSGHRVGPVVTAPVVLVVLAGVLAAALGALGCRGERPNGRPNVVVVVADTLRADRLGAYGNARGLTPFLDELAARGTKFTRVYAASSWTRPSVASLFTSRYPSQHGAVAWRSALPDGEVTLAERLAARGYRGLGLSANLWLSDKDGFAQGFERWRMFMSKKSPKVRGDRLRAETLKALAAMDETDAKAPRFLYLQYMEPHSPYLPPEPFRQRFQRGAVPAEANEKLLNLGWGDLSAAEVDGLEALYDGEVASFDDQVRQLFAALEPSGLLRNAVVVITSDHGEEFREHGLMSHGFTLYEESIRVPLIVVAPGFAGGTLVEDPVSLIDVAPTILDLAGLPPEPLFEGRSLVPLLGRGWAADLWAGLWPRANAAGGPRDILSELEPNGGGTDMREHSAALVSFPRKLLIGRDASDLDALVPEWRDVGKGGPQVFDLAADPGEIDPNPAKLAPELPTLIDALSETRSQLGQRKSERRTAPMDESTKEHLRALGYLE